MASHTYPAIMELSGIARAIRDAGPDGIYDPTGWGAPLLEYVLVAGMVSLAMIFVWITFFRGAQRVLGIQLLAIGIPIALYIGGGIAVAERLPSRASYRHYKAVLSVACAQGSAILKALNPASVPLADAGIYYDSSQEISGTCNRNLPRPVWEPAPGAADCCATIPKTTQPLPSLPVLPIEPSRRRRFTDHMQTET